MSTACDMVKSSLTMWNERDAPLLWKWSVHRATREENNQVNISPKSIWLPLSIFVAALCRGLTDRLLVKADRLHIQHVGNTCALFRAAACETSLGLLVQLVC